VFRFLDEYFHRFRQAGEIPSHCRFQYGEPSPTTRTRHVVLVLVGYGSPVLVVTCRRHHLPKSGVSQESAPSPCTSPRNHLETDGGRPWAGST
jgi:hypothetical protein